MPITSVMSENVLLVKFKKKTANDTNPDSASNSQSVIIKISDSKLRCFDQEFSVLTEIS